MILTCGQCGGSFERPPYYVATYSKLFCSSTCYGTYRRTGAVDAKGYRTSSHSGKFVKEHRRIIETAIGRPLLPDEDVHHINGDKSDNRLSNLRVIDHRDHSLQHNPTRWSIETAVTLIKDGWSLNKVAKRLGVSRPCMTQSLRRRGLL